MALLTGLSNLPGRPMYLLIWTKMVLIMIIIRNRSVCLGLSVVFSDCQWRAEGGNLRDASAK